MHFFNKNLKFSSKIKIEMTNCKNSSVRAYICPFLLYMPIFSFIGPPTAEKFTKEIQFWPNLRFREIAILNIETLNLHIL